MEKKSADEIALKKLFYAFIDSGLQGRFEEAFSFLDKQYVGVGMGEQGIVHSKEEAETILKDSYIHQDDAKIEFKIQNFVLHRISDDVASMVGEVQVYNTPSKGNVMRSDFMQSVGAKCVDGVWSIVFTHASPNIITSESIAAYPIRFMDDVVSKIREDIQNTKAPQKDALTGILNREGFEQVTHEIMNKYDPKHNTALFMVDLDDFKQINDRLGHQTGDVVLQQVAKVLQSTFRSKDAVGRIGGDEFMVLVTGNFSSPFLAKKADELMHAMRLQVNGHKQMPISISIGVAFGRARTTFEKLYRIADMAMYSAKKAGKRQYHIFNADTNSGHSYSASGVNLISLQTLLDYTDGDEALQNKTPYEALLENIPGGVVVYEIFEDRIKVNHSNEWFSNFLGYSEEEVQIQQDQSPFVYAHPDDLHMVLENIQSIRKGADNNNIVYRVRHKGGHYVYMNQVTTVTERRKDSIIVYGIETDVDQVIHLKQEVEEARKELEVLIENVPGSVVMFELTKDKVKATHRNNWLFQLLDYTHDDLKTMRAENHFAFCHPDDLAKLNTAIDNIRNGDEHNSIVYRMRHKNGSYRHLAQSVAVITREKDRVFMYGIQSDVEEMYHLKQKVENSQKELETLIQAIPGGILNITIKDTLTLSHRNEWAAHFLGYTKEELQAIEKQDPLFLVHPDDKEMIYNVIKGFKQGKDYTNFIYRLLDRNGVYRYVRINASIVERSDCGLLYNGVITDVDEMIQIQKELESTNHKFEVLLTALPGGIATYEINDIFKITNYGDWTCKFAGYESEAELATARCGDQLATVWHEDIIKMEKEIDRIKKGEIDRMFQTIRIVCKDGSLRSMNIHGSIIKRTSNKITMYVIYTEASNKRI